MKTINTENIARYVEAHIGEFHDKRIKSLEGLKLKNVLKRKNPYLFRAKNALTSEQIVRGLVDAHLSSNEETLFGDEGLAIFINQQVYGGYKSGIKGIDLEFDDEAGRRCIVAIKSGPNWGNSSQIVKMKTDFLAAKRTLRTSNSGLNIVAVNGCCYGRDNNPDKGDYFKYCGQRFWQFISNERNLYTEIIEPLGYRAKEKNDAYEASHTQQINLFTRDFANVFCKKNGAIDWEKLVRFNASEEFAQVRSMV
ncbi:MAG: hypothetical protein LBF51_00630 [Zoogloeaceae bacterium]|jgi:hypothetical protein|nr:hypothetical protein [Zoogloeaceae bacterium]